MNKVIEKVGVVVIGRNEGERLKRCLRSIIKSTKRIIYVDSGSTDGSKEFAHSLGLIVVELDMSRPFTMARGRNTGFEHLMEIMPDSELLQFIDGDCELVSGYLEAAAQTMYERSDIAIVTGRRLERYPNASIYNRLCDMEWGKDIGEIKSCGGDMMVRPDAFRAVGMFNTAMIAGEEPELCVRLRMLGGKIMRIDYDMTIHDAAMYKFRQWWKRAVRGGHAYAEGAAIHGYSQERHKVRDLFSALLWGAVVPSATLIFVFSAVWWNPAIIGAIVFLGSYLVLYAKIYKFMRKKGFEISDARLFSVFCILGKIPTVIGILRYLMNRLLKKQSSLIEYKGPASSCSK